MIIISDAKHIRLQDGDFCLITRKADGITVGTVMVKGPRELLELASALGDIALDWQNQDAMRAEGQAAMEAGQVPISQAR